MALKKQVATGDLRKALEALRDHLAAEIENGVACKACGGAVSSPTAALAKQLRDVLTQLSGMAAPKESKTDDLKAKRAARQAGVASGPPARKQRGARSSRARS